ncbi:MAG: hypothetical protein CML03_01075 [Pseudooceanicola sp.]|nr:hypothetical protein [Pseudooceanicola sp.]
MPDGSVASGGKLYFYESESTPPVDKAVYTDPLMTIAHTNPIVLDSSAYLPDIYGEGLYSVVYTDENDVQVWERDDVGATDDSSQFADWSSIVRYRQNEIVRGSDGNYYRSIDSNNAGHNPVSSPEYWEAINFITVWNEFVIYDDGDTVTHDGRLWLSSEDGNIDNEPGTGPEWEDPADMTPGEILTRLKTVDGEGSGLDSDLLDGKEGGEYLLLADFNSLSLYKGPWEEQSGSAAPPYLVDYGAGSNAILYSENLSDSAWAKTRLDPVVDSGVAAPEIYGQTFGDYWKVIPNATNSAAHFIGQGFSPSDARVISFLVREGGYSWGQLDLINGASSTVFAVRFSAVDGSFTKLVNLVDYDVTMEEVAPGDWLLKVSYVGAGSFPVAAARLYVLDSAGAGAFAGNGVDGLLVTRMHVSEQNARYAKTTTTAIAYTPPKIYQLLTPQSNVKAVVPGTDNEAWSELGSGGGIEYIGTQTYTSADEDGSGNIDIPVDFSDKNWVNVDCSDASISTAGAFEFDITGLQTDKPKTYTIHIKGGAVKFPVNFALPDGWGVHWHAPAKYKGEGGTTAAKRAGHTWIEMHTSPLSGQNANFSTGDARSY